MLQSVKYFKTHLDNGARAKKGAGKVLCFFPFRKITIQRDVILRLVGISKSLKNLRSLKWKTFRIYVTVLIQLILELQGV